MTKVQIVKTDLSINSIGLGGMLRELAHSKKAEVAHIVLARYLKQDAIDTVIPVAKRAEQVQSNLKADEIQSIRNIFS